MLVMHCLDIHVYESSEEPPAVLLMITACAENKSLILLLSLRQEAGVWSRIVFQCMFTLPHDYLSV